MLRKNPTLVIALAVFGGMLIGHYFDIVTKIEALFGKK